MEPSVQRVAEAVQQMLVRPWPVTAEDLDDWVRRHHLEGVPRDGFESAPLRDWPGTTGGLNFFDGHFVGVVLFLWSGHAPVELVERFRRLSQALDVVCGEAVERWGSTGTPAALWRDATHTVQSYAHTGLGNTLQLHVDHTALSEAQEAAAVARHAATVHPLAALGAPVDSESYTAAVEQTRGLTKPGREGRR